MFLIVGLFHSTWFIFQRLDNPNKLCRDISMQKGQVVKSRHRREHDNKMMAELQMTEQVMKWWSSWFCSSNEAISCPGLLQLASRSQHLSICLVSAARLSDVGVLKLSPSCKNSRGPQPDTNYTCVVCGALDWTRGASHDMTTSLF